MLELSERLRRAEPVRQSVKNGPRFRQRLGELTVLAQESLVPLLKPFEAALDLWGNLSPYVWREVFKNLSYADVRICSH